jgi:small subunit ribosomal protein S17
MAETHTDTTQANLKKMLIGTVVSDKMDKTVVVRVERTYLHPRLKKVVRTSKSYKVHDAQKQARAGDVVRIYEGRPQSKTKYMYLATVLQTPHSGGSAQRTGER